VARTCRASLIATLTTCHPEAVESAAEQRTPNEGPLHSASGTRAADKSMDPSSRKKRSSQDDKRVFRSLVAAGQRLSEIHVH
jgi:hypothetical protein